MTALPTIALRLLHSIHQPLTIPLQGKQVAKLLVNNLRVDDKSNPEYVSGNPPAIHDRFGSTADFALIAGGNSGHCRLLSLDSSVYRVVSSLHGRERIARVAP
jgi:hypothetical protein